MVGSLRPRVLIVEDDVATRTLYRRAFLLARYEVVTVADGIEALNAVDLHLPDAVVLDLGLPRMSGRDVQEELSHRIGSRPIPTVVVTGSEEEVLPHRGIAAVLRKPVDPGRIVAVVGEALTRSRTRHTHV